MVFMNYTEVILYLGIQSNATYLLETLAITFLIYCQTPFISAAAACKNVTNSILHRLVVYIQFYLIIFSTVI